MNEDRLRRNVINMTYEHGCSRRRRERDVVFPYGKALSCLLLLSIGIMVIYRLSEAAGKAVESACMGAIIVSFIAAATGILPIYKVWGKELIWVALGVFLSGVIRMLIGFLGVAIIIIFTDIQRIQFVGFLALFYVAFLAIDAWLGLWLLRHTDIEEAENQEAAIHGNIWDIVIRNRRSA